MDWSWGLLDDDERRVLADLSVFSGGWTLDAAQGVSTGTGRHVTDVIGSLVAKSLVIADQNRWGSRYALLETVRMYAQLRLSEREDAKQSRTRHAQWFATWTNTWSFEDQWASAELASRRWIRPRTA